MDQITGIISRFKFMILDGGQATELERLGCDLNSDLWSAKILVEDPEKIQKVHTAYLEAGADCISTFTYQATNQGFEELGLSEAESDKMFDRAITLACQSREEYWDSKQNKTQSTKPLVAGSIGSYGAFLADGSEYRGNYDISDEELFGFHYPRIKKMAGNPSNEFSVDLLAFETIPSLSEAKVVVKILENFPDISAWLSFSLKDETHISEGTLLREIAASFEGHEQIKAIGVNCTNPAFVKSAITELKSDIPVVVYPNSGESYNAVDKKWSGKTDFESDYYHLAKIWYETGAQLIGGCCRTTPDDIKQIARFRNELLNISM